MSIQIQKIGIIGVGTMGAGIAQMGIQSGHDVVLFDAVFAPITIGYLAMHGSIGTGLMVMGAAYFLCGLIPALFIKDRLYDPQKAE